MNESVRDTLPGHFQNTLRSGRFTVTAEITPPVSADPQALLKKALPLRGLADAVNVTDGASARASMSALAAAAILTRNNIEPILQFTCRDRNRIALQSDLLGAAALNIRNLLILRGDDPSAGDQPDAKPVFDLDTRTLTAIAAGIRDRGELPSGRRIEGPVSFFLGAADSPIDPPPRWTPDGLKAKVTAGAQFAQTQFCMDIGIVRRYMARLVDEGITEQLFVLVGIAPLASARSARWIRDNLRGSIIPDALVDRLDSASDPKQEGRKICTELMAQFAEIPGVAGAHLMAPLNETAIPAVIKDFRKIHPG